MREFDYDLDYKNLDLRAHPELYRVGRGEQGVLLKTLSKQSQRVFLSKLGINAAKTQTILE